MTSAVGEISDLRADVGASRILSHPVDTGHFPTGPMPPRLAANIIKGLRNLDAPPRLNLASFVTTYMEPECEELMMDAINVNYIDAEEYPSTQRIKAACVSMLGDLWHAEAPATGTDTVGSSEAAMLGGLAMKRRWQERRKKEGKDISKPNIVMGAETHVVWEKLCTYMEIEWRWVANRKGVYMASNEDLVAAADENTIGIIAIMGTTYTGHYYDVEDLDKRVAAKNKEMGWQLGIHVDAASGGFVAPFLTPDLKWDFRLPNVVSINASGHKFGLVYPGIGWVMWRSKEYLPSALVFHDAYLGADQISFTLNFSKSAMNVIGQFYQFIRYGHQGYQHIMEEMQASATMLRCELAKLDYFKVISAENALPLVAFHLNGGKAKEHGYDEFHVAERLRIFGWVVPAYPMAKNNEDRLALRVLCREDFSPTMVQQFVEDLKAAVAWLDSHWIYSSDQLTKIKEHSATNHHEKKKRATDLNERGKC